RGLGIVARELGLRPVDHANEPLEPRRQQLVAQGVVVRLPQIEQETLGPAVTTEPLIAVGVRGTNLLDLDRTVPVAGRGNGAAVSAKTDQGRIAPEPLAAELADVEFVPDDAHLGRCGVADMR